MADVGAARLGLAAAPAFDDETAAWPDGEGMYISIDEDLLADVFPVDVRKLVVDWPIAAAAASTFVSAMVVLFLWRCCKCECEVVAFGFVGSSSTAALHLFVADTTIVSAIALSSEIAQ